MFIPQAAWPTTPLRAGLSALGALGFYVLTPPGVSSPPPRPYGPVLSPTVGSYEGAVSYERLLLQI